MFVCLLSLTVVPEIVTIDFPSTIYQQLEYEIPFEIKVGDFVIADSLVSLSIRLWVFVFNHASFWALTTTFFRDRNKWHCQRETGTCCKIVTK